MMNNIQLTVGKKNVLFDEARFTAAHQNYKESRHDRSFRQENINEQTEKVTIFSLNLDFDKSLKSDKELIYYGFEIVYNDIKSVAQTRNIITGMTVRPAQDIRTEIISTTVFHYMQDIRITFLKNSLLIPDSGITM